MQLLRVSLALLVHPAATQLTETLEPLSCELATTIVYNRVGGFGTYDRIVQMNGSTGQCALANQQYAGPLAPFNEELSLHLRGPLHLQSLVAFVRDEDATTWIQDAVYLATRSVSEGLVFLNNLGNSNSSGVFDYAFGSSLSFASHQGTSASREPHILGDVVLPSGAEITIMRSLACGEENGSCGYYRPGTVAYHGFSGPSKIFLLQFTMPNTEGENMPAIWFLNAQIPRTEQYGKCSCWPGCGEFDVFEILTPGGDAAMSTIHGNKQAGSGSCFRRPTSEMITFAVIMHDDTFKLTILGDIKHELDQLPRTFITSLLHDS